MPDGRSILEMRHGASDELIRMLERAFSLMNRVPSKLKEKLEKMPYCVGFYHDSECVAVVFGTEFINLIICPEWRGRFINRHTLKSFLDFFFTRYKFARVESLGYNHLWKRLGFKEFANTMWAAPEDIRFYRK